MKVKIGNTIFNSLEQPIMIILEEDDKTNIGSMPNSNNKYCSFPEEYDIEEIKQFMK